jgi:hypothetical protein
MEVHKAAELLQQFRSCQLNRFLLLCHANRCLYYEQTDVCGNSFLLFKYAMNPQTESVCYSIKTKVVLTDSSPVLYYCKKLLVDIWNFQDTENVVLWDMTPCGSSKKNRRFGGTYRLHLQGNKPLSLSSYQGGSASRRSAKRASCNHSSSVVFIRYRAIVVYGPSLHRIYNYLGRWITTKIEEKF